jgi:transposase-like protein
MPRGKKFTAEQIIGKFREAEVGLAQGKTVPEVVRKLGVTEQTYYRWKREYGGTSEPGEAASGSRACA